MQSWKKTLDGSANLSCGSIVSFQNNKILANKVLFRSILIENRENEFASPGHIYCNPLGKNVKSLGERSKSATNF